MNEKSSPVRRSLYRGKFLELAAIGHWEFVHRNGSATPVGIVAITADRRLLLISQYRIPVQKMCIEIPAGLAGDGEPNEEWKTAAIRELREETGYSAEDMELLTEGATSAGLTSECMKLVMALGVHHVGEQELDGDEQITVHAIPIGQVEAFLREREQAGQLVDPKVYAALYFAMRAA